MKILNTLRLWQERRFLWILMAGVTIILTLIAHYFFQDYLYMEPCEQCVYIRFAMLVMALGGIIAAIYPNNITRIIGYTLGFYGIIIGINFCLTLDAIHTAVHSSNPFGGVDGCREIPIYPFALPLHELAPSWFLPTGECGFDNPIVPEDAYATLSSIQKFFVGTADGDFENGFYSNGWYLIPSWHFMNMAMACLLCFVCCLIALFAMFVGFFTRDEKNAKIQGGIVVVLVIILLYVGEAMKVAKIAQMAS